MLHHVAVGPFLEQPAGKVAAPFIVGGAAHVELHESAGFLHIFPGGGGFAGLQPDDRIAHAQRIARFHGEVGGDAVALVEQADPRHALRHRRAGQGACRAVADLLPFDADRAGLVGGGKVIAIATRQQEQGGEEQSLRQDRQERPRPAADHDASGLQAS